jgi:hypothetical protein
MMKKGRLAFLFVVFLIFTTLVKATDITECTNITSPGTYTMTVDIIGEHPLIENPVYYSCIDINADNVILNCQNHAIYDVYNDSLGATATGITILRDTPTDTHITIENCVVAEDLGGIYIENASFNTLNNITTQDNWGDMGMGCWAGTGICLEHSDSNIITDIIACGNNATYSASGIDIRNSINNTVEDSLLCSNQPIGLYLYNTNSSTFRNINITNSTTDGCGGPFYTGCGDGLSIDTSFSNNFSDIITYNNEQSGIGLYYSDDNTFSNILTTNNILDGILIFGSSNNAINDSWIYNNSDCGVYIDSSYLPSQDNSIDTSYINNTINAWFNGDIYDNTWNTTALLGGGNFWATPTGGYSMNCTDANADGFCDTAYDVLYDIGCSGNCSNNTDYLPLAYLSCGYRGLNVTTYDELTDQQIYFNIYVTNGTANMTEYNIWNFSETACNASLPTGNITIAITNASYYGPAEYVGFIGLAVLKAYLLPLNDTYAVLGTFIVQDAGTSPPQGIPNALVEVYKNFGGWPVLIQSKYTDGIGSMSMYVDSQKQYIANASAVGYYPKSVAAIFSNSSVVYIYLNRLAYGIGFPNPYSNVNWTLLPANHDLYQGGNNTNFIFTISSKNGTLTNYGMNITNASGNLLSTGSGSAANGSQITSSINVTQHSGYLNVTIWFVSPLYQAEPFIQVVRYVIYPASNGIGQQIIGPGGLIATSGMSMFAMGLLALIISLAITGAFSTIGFSIGKGGVLFTLCMTFFAGLGFLSGMLYLELIMITVSFVIIRWL